MGGAPDKAQTGGGGGGGGGGGLTFKMLILCITKRAKQCTQCVIHTAKHPVLV